MMMQATQKDISEKTRGRALLDYLPFHLGEPPLYSQNEQARTRKKYRLGLTGLCNMHAARDADKWTLHTRVGTRVNASTEDEALKTVL